MSLELALNPSIRPAFITATNAVIPLVNIHAPSILQNATNILNNFHLFFAIVSCAYILSTMLKKFIYYH